MVQVGEKFIKAKTSVLDGEPSSRQPRRTLTKAVKLAPAKGAAMTADGMKAMGDETAAMLANMVQRARMYTSPVAALTKALEANKAKLSNAKAVFPEGHEGPTAERNAGCRRRVKIKGRN